MSQTQAKVKLGHLYMTRGITDRIIESSNFNKFVWESLARHARGDWGFLCDEDRRENEHALLDGRLQRSVVDDFTTQPLVHRIARQINLDAALANERDIELAAAPNARLRNDLTLIVYLERREPIEAPFD